MNFQLVHNSKPVLDVNTVKAARLIFDTLDGSPRQEVLDVCEQAGINRNTASAQLYKWRKERAR
jgi:hypothetical protein